MKSSLLEGLEHFFTTRESFIKTKDAEYEDIVAENKRLFCEHYNVSNIVYPSQTHSSNVQILRTGDAEYPETDGLIIGSDIKDTITFLNFADCTPLIFYDGRISAISHAGWRGTASKIAQKTVQKMTDDFSCDVDNIRCAIGPAISMCCYNVGEDVLEQLLKTVNNSEGLYRVQDGKYCVDLKNINRRQLVEIGIKPENIDICPYCTVCNNDLFFSYRKENATTNRHSAVVVSSVI